MKNMKLKGSVAAVFFVLSGCGTDEVSDMQYYEKAEQYYEAENLHASLIELKNALQRNGEFYDARILLGDIYLAVGVGETAHKEFLHAERVGGGSALLTYKIAKSLQMQRKYDDVLLLESKLMQENSENGMLALGHALLAEAYLKENNVDVARSHANSALALDESPVEVRLANIKVMSAEGRYENSRAEMSSLLESHSQEPSVWYLQANMMFSRGEFEKATVAFDKVIQLEPKKPLTRKAFSSKIGLARAYMLDGKTDQAKAVTDELLKLKSKHPAVIYLGASIAYDKKDLDTALTALLEVVAKAPSYYPAVLLLGATQYGKGNYEQANVEFERYLTEFPENGVARKLLAATNMKLNKPEAVIDVLEPMLAKGENDAGLLMMVGRASFQVGDTENALQYMKKAKLVPGGTPEIAAELARVYFSQGDYQSAVDELSSVKGEGEEQAKVAMVVAYIQDSDIANARKLAKELIAKHPDNENYLILLGGIELSAGERLLARGYFEDSIIRNPSSPVALLSLARMDMNAEKFDSAKKGFERVLTINPSNLGAMFGMAQLAEQRGDITAGAGWLEDIRAIDSNVLLPRLVLGRYYLGTNNIEKALEIAEEAKVHHIEEPALLLLLSQIYAATGNFDNALIINNQLVDALPEAPGAYVQLAKTEIKLKKHDSAKRHLEKAIGLKPDYGQAKALLATVSIYLKEFDTALEWANDIKRQFPDLPLGYRLSGIAYSETGKLRHAEKAFEEALDLADSSELVLLLAKVYADQQKFSQAEDLLLGRLKHEEKDIAVIFQLALLYQETENLVKAERYYLQVLDYGPGHVNALNNLAMLLLEKNESVRALDYAKQAYRLDAANVFVKDTYGWALVLSGYLAEGMELIEDAAISTEHPSVQYHYAYALYKQGRIDEARRVLGNTLDSGAEFPERVAAEELFEKL